MKKKYYYEIFPIIPEIHNTFIIQLSILLNCQYLLDRKSDDQLIHMMSFSIITD